MSNTHLVFGPTGGLSLLWRRINLLLSWGDLNWGYFSGCTLEQILVGMALREDHTSGSLSCVLCPFVWALTRYLLRMAKTVETNLYSMPNTVEFKTFVDDTNQFSLVKNTYGILGSWLRILLSVRSALTYAGKGRDWTYGENLRWMRIPHRGLKSTMGSGFKPQPHMHLYAHEARRYEAHDWASASFSSTSTWHSFSM